MSFRLLAALPIFAVVMLGSLAPQTAKHAAACSLAPTALEGLARGAQAVIVGEVVDERLIKARPYSYDVYESTVRVEAVLKGTVESLVTLSPLGSLGPDCTGGPRLQEGERVLLLFGYYTFGFAINGNEQGKYVLAEGLAENATDPPIPIEDALRRVAAITGAPQDQLDASLAFALGGPLPAPVPEDEPVSEPEPPEPVSAQPEVTPDDGGRPVLLIALASLGLVAVTGALFALRLRRARN